MVSHFRPPHIWVLFFATNALVIIATLNFPVFLWDHFTISSVYFPGDVDLKLSNTFATWWWSLSGGSSFIYRPTYAVVYYLLFNLFAPQFWAFYTVKWLIFFGTVWLYMGIIHKLGASRHATAFFLSFLLFHPSHPILMLFSADLLVAFFAGLVIRYCLIKDQITHVDLLQPARIFVLACLILLALGVKEASVLIVGFLLIGNYSVGILWNLTHRRPLLCGAGACLLFGWSALTIGYALILVLRVSVLREAPAGGYGSFDFFIFLREIELAFPQSPWHVLPALGVVTGVGWLVAIALRWKSVWNYRKISLRIGLVVCIWLAAFMNLAFVTAGQTQAAPRYAIPSAFLIACSLAIMADGLIPSRFRFVLSVLSVLIPAWNLGSIYKQALAYQYHGWEIKYILGAISSEWEHGSIIAQRLRWGEWQANIGAIFSEKYAPRLGLPPIRIKNIEDAQDDALPVGTVMLVEFDQIASYYRPGAEIVVANLASNSALQFGSRLFERVAKAMGVSQSVGYDVGAPMLDASGKLTSHRLALIKSGKQELSSEYRIVSPCSIPPVKLARCEQGDRIVDGKSKLSFPVSESEKIGGVELELKADFVGYTLVGLRIGSFEVVKSVAVGKGERHHVVLWLDSGVLFDGKGEVFIFSQGEMRVRAVKWRAVPPIRMISVVPRVGGVE